MELISAAFAKAFGLRHDPSLLRKIKDTPPQFNLDRAKRLINEKGAYAAGRVNGMSILLIDDIYTTGSTVNEASSALKVKGAKSVSVLTLARAVEKGI